MIKHNTLTASGIVVETRVNSAEMESTLAWSGRLYRIDYEKLMSTRYLDDSCLVLIIRYWNEPTQSLKRKIFSTFNNSCTEISIDTGNPTTEELEQFADYLTRSFKLKHLTALKILNEEHCAIREFGPNEEVCRMLDGFVLAIFSYTRKLED